MGRLTHSEIVTEAIELAGNTGLTTRARVWLSMILRELFEKAPLPVFLSGDISTVPITPATTTAGVGTLTLTGGAGSNSPDVQSIKRAWICTNGQTDFTELRVEHMTAGDGPPRAYTGVSGVANGRPQRLICVNVSDATTGRRGVTGYLDPLPDKAYAVWIVGEGYSDTLATYGASQVNRYPSDLTVVQGVYAMCLKHQADERFGIEWAEFRRMVSEDRGRFMQQSGANTRLKLSPGSFRPRNSKRNPWDWMGPK